MKRLCLALLWGGGLALAAPPRPPASGPSGPAEKAPPGSLWSENNARVMIGMDGNARRVGDLITVEIAEDIRSEVQADTQTKRESNVGGGLGTIFGIGTGITNANSNMGGELGLEVSSNAEFRGDGSTSRETLLTGTLTCRVVEVLPNGTLSVWGWKEVQANREKQYLVLTGSVRPQDIRADNTVDSRHLAELSLQFNGDGTVSDKQGPGLGHRLLDHAWPF